MKKTILAVCTVFAFNLVNAQDFKHSISLSFGTATPKGDFGSLDINNNKAGGAAAGICIDLEYKGFLFHDKIGMLGLIKNQFNPMDGDYLALQTPVGTTVTSDNWVLNGYLLGAFYDVQLGEKGFFHPKVAVGMLNATSPKLAFETQGINFLTINSASSTGFSTMFGADFGLNLGNFKLQAQYDFLLANPTFNQKAVDETGAVIATNDFTQSMQTYNVKLSVGYNFGSK